MSPAARLHHAVNQPLPRDLAAGLLLDLETATKLDRLIAELCPGHETCEECDGTFCDLCEIASPGCDHDRNLCAECRGSCRECRDDEHEGRWEA